MDMLQSLMTKARLQTLTVGLFILVIVSTLLPWFKIEFFGVDESFSLMNGDLDTNTDMLILLMALIGGGISAYVLYLVNKNMLKGKLSMMASMVSVGAAGLALLFATLFVLDQNSGDSGEVVSVGIGYYVFVILSVAIIALNGRRMMANKAEMQSVMNDAKAKANNMTASKPATDAKPEEPKAM